MSDSNFKQFLESGRKIIVDTKTKKASQPVVKKLPPPVSEAPTDPHDSFCKRIVRDKPHKKHLVEFFEEQIQKEESKL